MSLIKHKVAFLGLGVMGGPMAGHLARTGHQVSVWNRTESKSQAWLYNNKGTIATSPKAAAQGAAYVFACVGNDDDIFQVALGAEGAIESMEKGSIFVDHTTASAEMARKLHEACSKRGVGFLDAPVSGGQAGAEKGILSIMCGGDPCVFQQAEPVMACYGKTIKLLGPVGSGQLAKMVNQICIAGAVQGLAEGLHFAQQAGLDTEKLVEVISQGAAGSWQMANRHKTMVEGKFDYGFSVEWMRKDLNITLTEARRNGANLPVTALVDQYYARILALGGRRFDTSSLLLNLLPPDKQKDIIKRNTHVPKSKL
eukprot:gb/GEZN01010486.1/.p1 GENE.gb/GEZN01010486.1/~~gb/GEZN01010486.1/.p1  ORF type:complete len:312 (-),score=46.98 gb/GEZN01010486.1/:203-1138(-)